MSHLETSLMGRIGGINLADSKKDDTLINILKIIAPGTKFREGLDNILKAKTGALIIIGDSKEIMDIVDGRI